MTQSLLPHRALHIPQHRFPVHQNRAAAAFAADPEIRSRAEHGPPVPAAGVLFS